MQLAEAAVAMILADMAFQRQADGMHFLQASHAALKARGSSTVVAALSLHQALVKGTGGIGGLYKSTIAEFELLHQCCAVSKPIPPCALLVFALRCCW